MLSRLWKSRVLRKATYAALTLTTAFAIVRWYFGIASGSDVKAYVGMALECHPVWQDLALHRVYKGQPVDELIKQTTPTLAIRHGRFVELTYQKPLSSAGVRIVAVDGRANHAFTWSCTWDYTFFDSLTDEQSLELSKSPDTYRRTVEYNGRTIVEPPTVEERGIKLP